MYMMAQFKKCQGNLQRGKVICSRSLWWVRGGVLDWHLGLLGTISAEAATTRGLGLGAP